jgi:2-keto-4-pentenoate hydratase/2-oxohepta-3-ene-1,7-dioic acid hydratase in catechol pathway
MWLDVNNRRMQTANSGAMIFSVMELVAYLSRYMTLQPGDLIATGTPPGVGLGRKLEPIYLRAGDEVSLGIDKLGEQRQRFINWRAEHSAR